MQRDHRAGVARLAFVALLGAAPVVASAGPEPLEVDLGATLQWAVAVETDGHFQSASLTFQPELELGLPEGLRLTAIARLRTDAFDRLEPGTPSQDTRASLSRRQFLGRHTDFELRELYLEGSLGRAQFTLGKQQIVWGTSDGLKVLDVVNPQSFREFILEDFEESRIPLWAASVELPVREAALQLVWLPDPTHHELPQRDGLFAITTSRFAQLPPPGVPFRVGELDRPGNALSDSDIGARLFAFWKGFDLTLNYLYYYHDAPITFRRAPALPGEPFVFEPGYERTHLAGGSLSRAVGDWVVRTELGYSTDRFFSTADLSDGDGAARSGEFAYVMGLDWYGLRDTLVSGQVFQSWLPSHRAGLARDALDTNVTLLLRRTFLNTTLTLDAIWIHNVNDGDGLVRPRARYELWDGLEAEIGLDLFYGPSEGVFGQFDDRDRLALRIRWSL